MDNNHYPLFVQLSIRLMHAIRLEHDALHFSASHFITFGTPEKVEALHGHNFRIRAMLAGPQNQRNYVADFLIAFDCLKKVCEMLSHKVLLPRDHPYINFRITGDVIDISLPPLRWSFPKDDTITLPIRNTTTESLAEYTATLFRELLEEEKAFEFPSNQYRITIELEESPGMWAVYSEEN